MNLAEQAAALRILAYDAASRADAGYMSPGVMVDLARTGYYLAATADLLENRHLEPPPDVSGFQR